MGSNLHYVAVDTPIPTSEWANSSDIERLSRLKQALTTQKPLFQEVLKIVSAKPDGQVIVCLKEQLPPNQRGTVLLDLEEFLKKVVDPGLVVWLDALGDRNSLRNLRGVEVKG